ncbi:uncharacterized protein LOC110022624 [Phalaenopsis equestris]|uniref:uncharacterized protein LOC110022624 n=1 Tax=Phalaenopsis equestris TaxID=78828 RepID=UPI0009E2A7E1|nr:uncharacterized protein LOC110022624 [Phalaenopsis equestris]
MQASLYLRAPQLSTLQCLRKSNFSNGHLRAIARSQISSSTPPPPSPPRQSRKHAKALALVATVVLASAMGFAFPDWRRKGRIGHAAPWQNVPISSGADVARRKQMAMRKKIAEEEVLQLAADEVLEEMFRRKDLPEEFYKIAPNYPLIKVYLENQLKLGDESWGTLLQKWKEIKPGPDQLEIGLLLIDVCIIKGNFKLANDIDEEIKRITPELDYRIKIRRAIVKMIKDWDKKKEWEKKIEWEKFAKNMQDIVDSSLIDIPEET